MMRTLAANGPRRCLSFLLRPGLALVALLLSSTILPGCGEPGTGVILSIDSSLRVPEDVDRLIIRISAEGFADKTQARALDRAFPHTLGIDLDSGSATLTIAIWGMKGDVEVTSVQLEVRPVPGEVIGAEVVL